ncbi:hypothetical protein ACDW_22420 [Acidovorax sp. DW039]|nr:hypothetical protein ACDW_22420 [Acidovorax sp. DW039]
MVTSAAMTGAEAVSNTKHAQRAQRVDAKNRMFIVM